MDRTKRWEEELQRRLQEAELPVATDGWSQIEKRLYPTRTKMGWWSRRRVQWMAAAALLAGVLAGGRLWMAQAPNTSEERATSLAMEQPVEEVILNQQTIEQTVVAESVTTDKTTTLPHLPKSTERQKPIEPTVLTEPTEPTELTEPTLAQQPSPSEPTYPAADRASATAPSEQHKPNDQNEPSEPNGSHPPHRSLRSGEWIAQATPAPKRTRRLSLSIYGGSGSGHQRALTTEYGVYQDQIAGTTAAPPIMYASRPSITDLARKNYLGAEFEHQQPWSIGATIRQELSDRFSIESGLTYTLLRSKVRHLSISGSQALHMVGIPLRFNCLFVRGDRLSFYGGAGGSIERCLYAELGGVQVTEARTYFSIGGLLGAEYHISPTLSLYAEPELTHTLSRTRLRSVLNDEPTHLTLRIGVRFTLH